MGKFSFSKTVCIVFVYCAAAAIASHAQTFTSLASFNGPNGANPTSPLIQGSDGSFYGTTRYGGANTSCRGGSNGCGTVFKVAPGGMLTTLYSFCSQKDCADGFYPLVGLLQATDGSFYGTTDVGGRFGIGTIFQITAGGVLTTLYTFCQTDCNDGGHPSGLVQASDGNFYGTTSDNGANDAGTVFRITPGGTLATLYTFCSQSNCTDGGSPFAGLVQATDGNFYGTTTIGGTNNNDCTVGCGTVFKITPRGVLTTLYSFGCQPNCVFVNPSGLVQATDGNLYGTTLAGGANNANGSGTVFKITPGGSLTTLYSFCSQMNCTDGSGPAGLVQATDGNLYGTTEDGGANQNECGGYGCGTVFKITPRGILTTLYSFCSQANCADGSYPAAGLLQATNGNFYGTTYAGGTSSNCSAGGLSGCGTVFRLSVGLVLSPVQFVPVTPCRLVDTRNPDGEFGGPSIQGDTFRFFVIPDNQDCKIPSSAAAYSLNVTVVPHGPLGYLTIWPTGQNRPLVSTMNSLDGRIKANAAIVPAGASGAVSVFVTNTTDVVLDIDGYFAPVSGSTLAFYTLPPCRVADTRKSTFPPGLGVPHLSGTVARDFPVLNASSCNIPSGAQAYSLNFTAVPYPAMGNPLGYLELWPTGQQPQNPVSTLNNLTGTIVANAAIVPAGTGGDITAYASNDTDLVIDINGYFAAAGQNGLSLYPVTPCRVIDTRTGNGAFSGELTVDVVDSVCAPPSTAQAYVFNATVVPTGGLGYLTLWPDSQSQPLVSTLNAIDGAIASNMAIMPNQDGKTDAYASGITQLILDISSYFAP